VQYPLATAADATPTCESALLRIAAAKFIILSIYVHRS
jgi:hypothetical protein